MALTSMKMEKKMGDMSESGEYKMMDEYGYGTCIKLEEEQVKSLGITELPAVGSSMMMTAKVIITKTEVENDMEGESKELSMHIVEMELKPEQTRDAAATLFGSQGE